MTRMTYARRACAIPFLPVRLWSTRNHSQEAAQAVRRWPYASRLRSRSVVRFLGSDAFRFLQGLVSNDIRVLEREPPTSEVPLPTPNRPAAIFPPVYTALLSPQGRFLFDLFLFRLPSPSHRLDASGSGPASPDNHGPLLFCDADSSSLPLLLEHLRKYKLRADVEFEDVSEDISVWQRYGGPLSKDSPDDEDPELRGFGWGAGVDLAAQAASKGNGEGYTWFKDPRCAALGFRGIFPKATLPPSVEAHKEVDEIYFQQWRMELGIAEGSNEIPKDKANPLEYNLAWLNAISFDKGCYVGQELMARTHHRGVIRKRLLPITFVSEAGEELQEVGKIGAEIIDKDSQKKVGDITSVLGSSALGIIRLEAAHKTPAQLFVKDMDHVHVKLHIPKWWPEKWLPEDLQQA